MVSARPLVWRGRRGPRDQPGARLGGGAGGPGCVLVVESL